jgi:hypothetical protein
MTAANPYGGFQEVSSCMASFDAMRPSL